MRANLVCCLVVLTCIARADDSLRMRRVGTYRCGIWFAHAVALDSARDLVFLGASTVVFVLDVSNPAAPIKLSRIEMSDEVEGLFYQNNVLYVALRGAGLRVVAMADPVRPVELGCYDGPGFAAYGVAVADDIAYVAAGLYGLSVITVADPSHPAEIGRFDTPESAKDVIVSGDHAYVADGGAGLRIVAIDDPTQPNEVGYLDTPGDAVGVALSGDYAFVADGDSGMRVISIGDPSQPVEVGVWGIPVYTRDVAVAGGHAFVAAESGGLRVVSVADPAHPAEVGHSDTPGLAWAVAVLEGTAYIADFGSRLCVVSVTDPAHPFRLGGYDPPGMPYGVDVSGDRVYVAHGDGGLLVLSVADPAHPVEVGVCATPGFAWSVAVSRDHAYVADDSAGLRVISVADPARPVEVGACATPAKASDVVVRDEYAYVAAESAGLRVISVADPSHPVEVGYCETPDRAGAVAVVGDHAYVASNDAGLRVISIADPARPVEVGYCNTPRDAYGVAVAGDYAYVAAGQSGVRIISTGNPERPVEVGYIDSLEGAVGVAVEGGYAYVMPGNLGHHARVFSVADPLRPVEVGHYRLPGTPHYVVLSGGYGFLTDMQSMAMLQFLPPGDIDIDSDSLDVAADTLRLGCPVDTGHALGVFVLANTTTLYNPDTTDGPSVSPVGAIRFSGTLTGPGGTLDSVVLRNLPSSLQEGQAVVCTLAAYVPPELRNGDYIGSITISGTDTANLLIAETFYAFLNVSRQLGDLDVDGDSLDVVADTIRVRPRLVSAGPPLEYTEYALGEFILANTSSANNPDTMDGPSRSPVDSLSYTGSLSGPGGAVDSILIRNMPQSLAQGQTVVCTLTVYVPAGQRDGDYHGLVSITGRDTSGVTVDELLYARVTKLGDLDVDDNSQDVVHDTMNLHTQPAGPVYHPYAKAGFMLANTSSAYNPDAEDGPSRSPLRGVKVEAKVETQDRAARRVNSECRIVKSGADFHSSQFTIDTSIVGIYVPNLPESLAVGQAITCTLALVLPEGVAAGDIGGWVVVSALDTLGYQVRDSFFLKVYGPQPRGNLDSLRVAPIPFKPHQNPAHDAIHFQGLSAGARVIVYDASGQAVWTATESGDGHLKWDARVASGIYAYLVVAKDGASKVGKLSVIR